MSRAFLIVDDDQDDKELFKEALLAVDSDIICYCSENAEEAFDKLDNHLSSIELIFVDINLPEMSGWQFLRKIKRHEAYKHIPVLMYSTSSHIRDKEIAVDLGAICLITKPHKFKTLKDILTLVVSALNRKEIHLVKDDLSALL
jgi:CheY-like chemotaxis protein